MGSPEESPTRYMLPEQAEERETMIYYSVNEYSPAKYPVAIKKRKKKKDKEEKKRKKNKEEEKTKEETKGKYVHFKPKVRLKTIYHTLKDRIENINLTKEEEYPFRTTAFALKRKRQKNILKYNHQYRPLTARRKLMLHHIRETLQRVNGDCSSPPQTLPKTLTQTLS